jgi:hypothetical protein
MLQGMLWPRLLREHYGDERVEAEATLEYDGALWRVVVDGPRVRWQKEGADHPGGPVQVPAEHARRYHLSLHDLLAAEDPGRGLAVEIRRLAAGGFDFAAAADALSVTASGRPRSLVHELRSAREELRRARGEAKRIVEEGQELPELEHRLRSLDASAALLPALERLEKLQEARAARMTALHALDAFPSGMARLRDGDAELWKEISEREARLEDRLAELHREAEEAGAEVAATGLGATVPEGGVLARLEVLADAARERLGAVEEARARLASAEEERRAAAEALGLPPHLAPRGGWPSDCLPRLQALLGDGVRLEASLEQTRARITALGGGDGPEAAAPEAGDKDRLRSRRDLLLRWLASSPAGTAAALFPRGPLRLAAAVLLVVGSGVLASGTLRGAAPDPLVMGAGLVVAIVGVALALLRPPVEADERGRVEREVERMGDAPASWSERAVRADLDAVQRRLVEAENADLRRERRRELETQLRELEDEAGEWRTAYGELASELGLSPEADPLTLERAGALLVRLDEADITVRGTRGSLQEEEAALARTLDEASELLAPWGTQPGGVAELRAEVGELERRARAWSDARSRERRARRDAAETREDLEALRGRRSALARRCGVAEAELADFLGRRLPELDAYRRTQEAAAREEVRVQQALEEAEAERARHGEILEGLLDESGRVVDEAELVGLREDARAARGEADRLRERIGSVRRSLDDARRRHDLEEALARETAAVEALAAWREEEREKAAARSLLEWVRARAEERDRPRVFERARRVMEVITQGRHTVALDRSPEAGLRAVRSDTGEGLGLDQLSSGTRVQLLLAVRLAFVEVQEGEGPALPLLLDEVLGTSDDERAGAIVRAASALTAAGRQLLYFTAQADEIRKWQHATGEGSAAEVTTLGTSPPDEAGLPWPDQGELISPPPSPRGRDHGEYGRLLGVTPLSLWAPDPVRALHPWHLLDDPETTHRLLEAGLDRWGRVETLLRKGDPAVPAHLHRVRESMAPRAELCADLVELARIGRAPPVDRTVLEASGAVSDVFIERAAALARRVGGDAAALLRAIDGGDLKGFRSDKAEDLREHLGETGHLPDEAPLSPDELLTKLHFRGQRLPESPGRETLARWVRRWLRGPEDEDVSDALSPPAGR